MTTRRAERALAAEVREDRQAGVAGVVVVLGLAVVVAVVVILGVHIFEAVSAR